MEEAQLAQLMEEFVSRIRRGESPDPEDYASRYPQLAERIRELFPTLTMLENAAGRKNTSQVRQEGLSAGMVIGAYYIRKEIGRGGMGIVYEAVRITDQKRVALKVLPLHSHLETKSLERFFREARITADLKHPNIVPIFDIGQAGDTAYFAMQYIEGSGLDRYLRRLHKQPTLTGIENRDSSAESENRDSPPLPLMDHLEWVARVGIQAASGLAYAHSRNLIHRDIKPSNLLLDSDGRLWIADFGLARNLEDTTITATGVLLGTPRYMSPEQAEAGTNRLDQRTDIYSLGVTLYELATRRPVFDGETQREILFQIFTRNPLTPRRLNRSIPKDLDRIIMRAIAKRPDNRYQSAEDLANDLTHWVNKEPVRARPSKSAQDRPHSFLGKFTYCASAGVILLALILSGGLYYLQKIQKQPLKNELLGNNDYNAGSSNFIPKDIDVADPTIPESAQTTTPGRLLQYDTSALSENNTRQIDESKKPIMKNPQRAPTDETAGARERGLYSGADLAEPLGNSLAYPTASNPDGIDTEDQPILENPAAHTGNENINGVKLASPDTLNTDNLLPNNRENSVSPDNASDQDLQVITIDKAIRVRIGTTAPTSSLWHTVLQYIKQDWERISNNGLEIKIYENGTLGDEKELIRKVQIGQIQALGLSGVGLSQIDDSFACLQIPMMFQSYEELDYVRQQMSPKLERKLEKKGFKLLHWSDVGWIYTFTSEPVHTPDDLRNMKLFTTAGDPETAKLYTEFGFLPIPLSQFDMILSLEKGMINAINLPPYYVSMKGIHKLVPNMTGIKWAPLVAATVMDLKVWNKIPEKLQKEMLKVARNTADRFKDKIRNFGEESISVMEHTGLKVVELTDQEIAEWQWEAQRIYQKLGGRFVPQEFLDDALKLRNEIRIKLNRRHEINDRIIYNE